MQKGNAEHDCLRLAGGRTAPHCRRCRRFGRGNRDAAGRGFCFDPVGDCYYDPAADAYYQKNTQTEGSIPVEPVFAAGDKLSIQYRRYTGQDEAGNEVYRTYTAQLPIVGIVKSANSYTLLTTDRLISSGTIFVSTALYHKMFESAGSYFMEKEGYSSLNVKLSAGSNFSLRRSISSIATRRNGILSADNYDLISQSYTEGTQSAFLVGILAVFGVLLGCALLVVLNLSAYEVQQQRLSLLLTLGVSPKKTGAVLCKAAAPGHRWDNAACEHRCLCGSFVYRPDPEHSRPDPYPYKRAGVCVP